jgi:hypothetical protein
MCLQMLEEKNTYEENRLTLLVNSARRCNAFFFSRSLCLPASLSFLCGLLYSYHLALNYLLLSRKT